MADFEIAGQIVSSGELKRIEIPIARLPTQVMMNLPIVVLNGKKPGPKIWLAGAIHGDEVNGVRIIQEVIDRVDLKKLSGTIVAIPIVNVFGFLNQSRYFPDRRDLNRCFPGSAKGSLASRLAEQFMKEIVSRCCHGIDYHTGSLGKSNLPQLRIDFSDKEAFKMAKAFRASVVINSPCRKDSLRASMTKLKKPYILYEAGEANRFDPVAIKMGVEGTFRVFKYLKMYQSARLSSKAPTTILSQESKWSRASKSGILRLRTKLGDHVELGQPLAEVSNIYGDKKTLVKASFPGILIGLNFNTIVHQGDAVAHIAKIV